MVGLIPNVKECPLYDKGRWYRFIYKNNNDNYELVAGDDLEVDITNKKLVTPSNFVITDYKIDWPCVGDATVACNLGIGHISTDNKMSAVIPAATNISTALTIYIFGYFNNVE